MQLVSVLSWNDQSPWQVGCNLNLQLIMLALILFDAYQAPGLSGIPLSLLAGASDEYVDPNAWLASAPCKPASWKGDGYAGWSLTPHAGRSAISRQKLRGWLILWRPRSRSLRSRSQMTQTARYPAFAHPSSSGDLKESPDMASNRGRGVGRIHRRRKGMGARVPFKPIRPGGCSWRKITSRSGPFTARHARIRRSSVRRVPEPSSGCRRHSSSNMEIGRKPGAAFSIGRTSFSQTSANGSARRRSRGAFF